MKTPINSVIKFVVSLRYILKPSKFMIVDDFTVTQEKLKIRFQE